jgi:ribosomal protein S18 acetylase RimI-like enzyme
MIRLAKITDMDEILTVANDAIANLKADNVNQWQNGYPNKEVFLNDITNKTLFVYEDNGIQGICNLSLESDPSYDIIENGAWLTNGKYLVIHRIAVSSNVIGKGVARKLFAFAIDYGLNNNIGSIRIDTHRDNIRMMGILKKMGFVKCGVINLLNYNDGDSSRDAYELSINR